MPYLSSEQLQALGLKSIGENVKISERAVIYNPELISIGDNSRIDDFCLLSGNIAIGKFVHVTPMCLIAGGTPGVILQDYVTIAYGVKIFSQSDDYSGETMTNSLIPKKYKREIFKSVYVGRFAIIGAGSVVLPGADVCEGVSIGAMSLVLYPTEPWGIYAGVPVRYVKKRNKNLLNLSRKFEGELSDSV